MALLNTVEFKLPNNVSYTVSGEYDGTDTAGVTALAVAAGISCISTGTLLILLVISATRRFQAPGQVVFIRTHVAPYFVSLLFCDFWQSIGSLLNVHWVTNGRVFIGSTCTAQAAIKNGGNVGTAIWSMAIALHTFFVLFLGKRPWEPALYITLILVWTLIGLIIVVGPAALEDIDHYGPYYGVSGVWCWITEEYPTAQLTLEYLWMFISAFCNVILYLLIWLRLRGNLIVRGWRWRFRRSEGKTWDPVTGQTGLQAQVTSITRHMMMFPIVYFLVVLPIAGCRYAMWAGYAVPFNLLIFADVIFILQGFINVVLFCCTRSVIPADHQNMFGSNQTHGSAGGSGSMRRKGSTDDEESSMSMEPVTIQLAGGEHKPLRVQHVNHVISIEPAREVSPRPPPKPHHARQGSYGYNHSRQNSYDHARQNSLGNAYDNDGRFHPGQSQYSSVPLNQSPRLTPAELGKVNAHYASPQPPSRTPSPQLLPRSTSPQLIPRALSPHRGPSPRPRTPLRIVNATETIVDDDPRPYVGTHRQASESVSSYMTDDSSAPLTATHRSTGSHHHHHPVPAPIATAPWAPRLVVQAASPMTARQKTPEPLTLRGREWAVPDSVPRTARPPSPHSRHSHEATEESLYL